MESKKVDNIPPPTKEPTVAIPEEIAATPAVPLAPASVAVLATYVPVVADIIVAAEPPTTALAVTPVVPAVPIAVPVPIIFEVFMLSSNFIYIVT
ncbi:hypothetical protein NG782_10345 [Aliarcobacter cryaerophilus]|uniref:hypothetical protein n=1 Tax=Aliarcobacter cryaerophilus TaxID=28198 RepID=UPI003DA5375D